jgi:hypothetical protein
MKKILVCTNKDYNGSSCTRCLTSQDFLELNAFSNESDSCDNCGKPLSFIEIEEPKPPFPIKKVTIIACGIILLTALVYGGYSFFMRKSVELVKDVIPAVEIPAPTPVAPVVKTEEPVVPAEPVEEPAEPVEAPVKPIEKPATKPVKKTSAVKHVAGKSNHAKGTQIKNFSGGGKYVGEMKNGQMQGLGTFYYGQHELISPRDMKKRYADAGDYLIGEFYEGKVVSGKLYDANNILKEVIMIGR